MTDTVETTLMNRLVMMASDIYTQGTDDCTSQMKHIQTTLDKTSEERADTMLVTPTSLVDRVAKDDGDQVAAATEAQGPHGTS